MRLVWNLIEYFKSYLFRRQFRRQFSTVFHVVFAGTIEWYYGHCPVNSVEFERVLQKLLMRLVWNLLEYFNIYINLTSIQTSILNRFTCNFAHTIRSHCGDCPENLVRFDHVFQKLLMWCTETTLFPHRQSAENAGRHWNSTEEEPSLHRTCVTENEMNRALGHLCAHIG